MNWLSSVNYWFLENGYSLSFNKHSIIFGILIFFTLAVVAKFSKNYLKGEVGEKRFWLLFSFFSVGILAACFSQNLKTFYIGWEMVGLASFFLIGFYQTNSRSVENSLIALSNYKICDVFFVMAILLEESHLRTAAGFCLIIATLAKSAQLPFSSWLYRALEGPTPSSTLFYGGLSLHLGAFVLLQFSDLWSHSVGLRILLGLVGFSSAIYGFMVGSARSDLKTSFAFASISQVGLIYCEMALGYYELALWHIIGHNLLRTWNYLRGMSFFEEFFKEEYHNSARSFWSRIFAFLPESYFFHSMNAFYLDRVSLLLRKWSLIVIGFLGLCYLVWAHEGSAFSEILIFVSLMISIWLFVSEHIRPVFLFLGVVVSQVAYLFSIHAFFEDKLEHLYLGISFLSLMLLIFSIWPAYKRWSRSMVKGLKRQTFLALGEQLKLNHILFLLAAIILTGSPGTFEFFIQEGILDELWTKSHVFLILAMISLSLNTVHTFKIGQWAFLGESKSS